MKDTELLPVVDSSGNIVGKETRTRCHSGTMILHPVVHIHIIADNLLFLQKRSYSKTIEPGKWDTSVGGHIIFGYTVMESAFKEAEEELGIKEKFDLIPLKEYVWESSVEKEYIHVFKALYSGEIVIDNDEVIEGRFFSMEEIESLVGTDYFTPNFEKEFEMLKEVLFG